jgi:hypothetical protein
MRFKEYFSLFFVFLTFLVAVPGFAQDTEGPGFEFSENIYDFGDVKQGEKVKHVFTYKNTGNQPLIISNIVTTCGCTAPSWTKEPVRPGDKGEIKIEFNTSGKVGKQNKIITIFSNAKENKQRITIKANILPD